MMGSAVTKEADQISLLPTLVIYTQCKHEGMQETKKGRYRRGKKGCFHDRRP